MLGQRLRQVCEMIHPQLTQALRALHVASDYRRIERWQLGITTPNYQQLVEFCQRLETAQLICDVQWLLTGQGREPYFLVSSTWGAHIHHVCLEEIGDARDVRQRPEIQRSLWHCLRECDHAYQGQIWLGRIRDHAFDPFLPYGTYIGALNTTDRHFMSGGLYLVKQNEQYFLRQVFQAGDHYRCEVLNRALYTTPLLPISSTTLRPVVYTHRLIDEPVVQKV